MWPQPAAGMGQMKLLAESPRYGLYLARFLAVV
jgi:hypothetical protein